MIWAAGMHWSQSSRAWCGFFASLHRGPVLLRHELTWLGIPPETAADDIKAALKTWKIDLREDDTLPESERVNQLTMVVAQPELWPKDEKELGETVSETFILAGLPMVKGNGDRVNGFSRLRSWFAERTWTYHGKTFRSPSLIVHPDCRYFLRAVPTLVVDTKNLDDIDKTPEEFPVNGARYYAMSRPMPSVTPDPELPENSVGRELQKHRDELAWENV